MSQSIFQPACIFVRHGQSGQFIRRHLLLQRRLFHQSQCDRSSFIAEALGRPQTLTASRILPYPAADLYNIIADIEAYREFVPYCITSKITAWSKEDKTFGRKWPRMADLKVGYGPYETTYSSAVYCHPHQTLEAVSGEAEPTIAKLALDHYERDSGGGSEKPDHDSQPRSGSVFKSLLTRWTFHEYPFKPMPPAGQTPQQGNANAHPSVPRTQVNLVIEYEFSNPVYAAVGQVSAPKVAGTMIEAFQKRVQTILGDGHHPVDQGKTNARPTIQFQDSGASGAKA